MTPLSESLTCFHLYTLIALANVVETRESTVNISVDFVPRFDVEDRVALGNFSDYDPVTKLADLTVSLVSILGHARSRLVANRAHVVVVTMVYVGFVRRTEAFLKVSKGLLLVDTKSLAFTMQLETDS